MPSSPTRKPARETVVKDFITMNKNAVITARNSRYYGGTALYEPPSRQKQEVIYRSVTSPRASPKRKPATSHPIFSPTLLPPEPEDAYRKPFTPQINGSNGHLLASKQSARVKSPIRSQPRSGQSPTRGSPTRGLTQPLPAPRYTNHSSVYQSSMVEPSNTDDLALSQTRSSPKRRGKNSIMVTSMRSVSSSRAAAYNEIQRLTYTSSPTASPGHSYSPDRDIMSDNIEAVSRVRRNAATIRAPLRSEHYMLPSRRKYQLNYTLNVK